MKAIERYAAKQDAAKAKKAWFPPDIWEFKSEHLVLSFDQTLSKTGWVELIIIGEQIKVFHHETLKTKVVEEGSWGSVLKADQLAHKLLGVSTYYRLPDEIVAEQPAVRGYRVESSLMALREVHRHCSRQWRNEMTLMSIQRSRTLLAGPQARNDKKLGHQALTQWIPESAGRTWNEDQRDAAINALARLLILGREERDAALERG